jgi:hypothetical protein
MRTLLRSQEDVLTLSQASQHGWTPRRVRGQLDAGRWRRVVRGVYVTHTGTLTYHQRIYAVLLYCGDGCVANHETALWLADPVGGPPRQVHVLVPASRVLQIPLPEVVVHRSRQLPASDVHPARRPPRVVVERAVTDCLRTARTDDEAVGIIARTVQRGLSSPGRLHAAIGRASSLPRRAMLLDALVLAREGAHSAAEVRFRRRARTHGLPVGSCQYRIVLGGAVYLDVRYDQHRGRPVVLELDGRLGHFDVDSWRRDMLRDSLQVAAGDVVLRLPALLVFTQSAIPIGLVALALRREGWEGQLRRCRDRACGCHQWPLGEPNPWAVLS